MPDFYTPQLTFPGGSSWLAIAHGLAACVAAGLIWRLMLWERRLVSRGVSRWLLGLRLSALCVVLLTLWQPTLAWVIDQKKIGRLVVALDVSDSMQTTDVQATSAERLRWMSALGWIRRDPQAIQAAIQNDLRELPQVPVPPGLDAATWNELSSRLAQLSRLEIARRSLTTEPQSILSQLSQVANTACVVYAGASLSVDRHDLESVTQALPDSLQRETTLAGSALRTVELGDTASPVLGVLLLTDGRDADAAGLRKSAELFGQNGVPLFPVVVGSARRPKDLSIISVDTPLAVYRGDRPSIKVLVSTVGFDGPALDVTLDLQMPDPKFPPQVKTIVAADGPQQLEFELSAEDIGSRDYVITLPVWEGETRTENNRREFTLQVVDDRSRVLLVDGEPRWEFRYLEIALARDERVEAEAVLFRQPYLGVLPEPFFRRQWPAAAPGNAASALTGRDLVIVGDVAETDVTPARWKELEHYVSEQGGMLVFSAGRSSLPLRVTSPELARLLPITAPNLVVAPGRLGTDPTSRGWNWTLTPDGELQTLLQMVGNAQENRRLWNLLPGAGWAIAGVPKPAATVWAEGRSDAGGAPIPLIVHQHYGLGQVLWIATDSTWRWRFRSADQFHHRFWGQLARYAAESKLSAGNEFAQFGALQSRYEAGAPVELQARWSARFLEQTPEQRSAIAEIYRGGERVSEVPLLAEARRPLISSGSSTGLPSGDYVARLVAPGLNLGPTPLEARFSIAPPTTAELAELSANVTLLQELARASGGQMFHLDELDQIPSRLRNFSAVTSIPQERPLWDRWPTLLLLCGLLSAEWILRRQNGLP